MGEHGKAKERDLASYTRKLLRWNNPNEMKNEQKREKERMKKKSQKEIYLL